MQYFQEIGTRATFLRRELINQNAETVVGGEDRACVRGHGMHAHAGRRVCMWRWLVVGCVRVCARLMIIRRGS